MRQSVLREILRLRNVRPRERSTNSVYFRARCRVRVYGCVHARENDMLMRMSMLVDVFMLVNVRMPVMFMTVLVFTLSVMMSAGAFSFMLMFFHNKTSNLATVCENKLRTAEYCCIFQASFSAAAVLFPDVIQSLIQN